VVAIELTVNFEVEAAKMVEELTAFTPKATCDALVVGIGVLPFLQLYTDSTTIKNNNGFFKLIDLFKLSMIFTFFYI